MNDKDAACNYKYTTGEGKIETVTAVAGTEITDTNISNWNLTTPAGLTTATYTTWYVAIKADGTVEKYSYQ